MQLSGFSDALALHKFCNRRSTSNSRDAALGKKANLDDTIMFAAQSESQDIATRRILPLRGSIRGGDFSGIARILEMIEQLWCEHILGFKASIAIRYR